MSLLSPSQLERAVYKACDILRNRMDTSQVREIVSAMLVLKRASDQPSFLNVPDRARWPQITAYEGKALGRVLNEALWDLEQSNPDTLKGIFETVDFDVRLSHVTLKALVECFDEIPLNDVSLESRDVIGLAYDRLLVTLFESDGKRGGEYFTPRSVIGLMVNILRPQEDHSVYDPFAGSGGMLIQAARYVDEQGGTGSELALFGQEVNAAACSTARLNLLLNGFRNSSLLCGDTLTDPLHSRDDEHVRCFDRVLTNPSFSMDYSGKEIKHPERMKYGQTPDRGGKADLMHVQHVLASLAPDGIGAVIIPHGVLFRGGVEAQIRQGIIEEGRLEAVIGIGPNVFYGTALPACVLILRGQDGAPASQNGQVLFVNAEREVVTGRSQNRLEPQNVEKILDVYREWADIPGFSRAVSLGEIAQNKFNLNIRRYVAPNAPTEPPLNVRAALYGGVPRSEVEPEAVRFDDFGIRLTDLFIPRDSTYLDFPAAGCAATASHIPGLTAPLEEELTDRCRSWWLESESRITELAGTEKILTNRSRLMFSFREELLAVGILDHYQLNGVFAAWWSARQDDLRVLDQRGFSAVADRWAADTDRRSSFSVHFTRKQVLHVLGEDLCSRVQRLAAAERQKLVEVYISWGDRYETSFADLERQSELAADRLKYRLGTLGYT
ncbi:N-6 DNA methylase [Streptomyces sp. NPDC054784]